MYIDKNYRLYSLFVMTLIFASLIINLFIKNGMDFNYMLLDIGDISYIEKQEVASSVMYVILKRLKHIVIILLLIKAFKIERVYKGFLVLGGVIFGVMTSIQIYYLGLTGMITFLLYILPHYLVYFYGLNYVYKLKKISGYTEEKIKNMILVSIIFLIGIISECIFSRFFLIKFYQYMVM